MITVMQPHLFVLGASANNEGWERRTWPNSIDHYPEPVPEHCIATVFPLTQSDHFAEVKKMLQDDYGNYPLMLAWPNGP